MSARTKALAAIVLVLILFDILLTVATCQQRDAQPKAPLLPEQPSLTPTETAGLIIVGPILTFTPSPTHTPVRAIRESPTPRPTITPTPTQTIPTATPIAPDTLPRTGGCKP